MRTRACHLLAFDLYLVIGILLYSVTSAIPFYLDDGDVVGEASYHNLPTLLSRAWTFGRWLVELTFAYTDYIRDAIGFFSLHRLTNILIHIFTSFEAYLVAFIVVRESSVSAQAASLKPEASGQASGRKPQASPQASSVWPQASTSPLPGALNPQLIAFLAGLLFLIHPLQTSTVNYLAQRYVLMATLFLFAAFLCYLRGRTGGPRLLLYSASAAFFVFGLFSKQFVLVFPALIFLPEWLVFRRDPAQLKKALLGVVVLILVSVLYLQFGAGINLPGLVSEAPHPPLQYAMTQAWVVTKYMQMLLAPFNLALNHDLPIIETPADPRFLVGSAALAALLAAALIVRKEVGLITFCIAWYIVLLAESSSFVPRIDFIYDYRTYPANLGPFILLALMAGYFCRKRRTMGLVVMASLLLCYGYLSYRQNWLWTSPSAFFSNEVSVYPRSAKSWNLLGRELFMQGKLAEAERAFRKSLEHTGEGNPLFRPVLSALDFFYLGLIEVKKGDDHTALDFLKKAVLASTTPLPVLNIEVLDSRVLLQLATLYEKTGDAAMWEFVTRQAISAFPRDRFAWKEYKRLLETTPSPPISPQLAAVQIELLLRGGSDVSPEMEKAVKTMIVVYCLGGLLVFLGAHYIVIRQAVLARMTTLPIRPKEKIRIRK